MGMAASQARFLGLTARLNNVEFEAQQIHQQRTALSNKSASYYTDLLGMSVPTAPSVEEYTKTVYTFNDGALTNQITQMVSQGNGRYKVSYLRSWEDNNAIVSAPPRIVTRDGSNFRIGSEYLRELGFFGNINGDNEIVFCNNNNPEEYYLKDGKFYNIADDSLANLTEEDIINLHIVPRSGIYAEGYYKDMTAAQFQKLSEMEAQYARMLNEEVGSNLAYVRYIQNTTTGQWDPVFYLQNDLLNANYDPDNNSLSNINAYTFGQKTRNEEIIGVEKCQIEMDSTGRYISITIPTSYNAYGDPLTTVTYALTTNTITDQEAYDDAMNQYEYDKATYDHSIAEINAKIEIIQAEDKDLELRLKQLDTEHNAIQTERDTVKDLIKKNVDSSFKTFG